MLKLPYSAVPSTSTAGLPSLVKTATTLDVLSGGRSYFAIGAAWNEQESKGLGVPFPPLGTRFELLEEALQIAKQMWSANDGPYHGKHNRLEETLCVPQPLSRPQPPILVAGGAIAAAATVFVDYNWGAPTRSVAGRIAGLDPSGQVWIDFWHQSVAAF